MEKGKYRKVFVTNFLSFLSFGWDLNKSSPFSFSSFLFLLLLRVPLLFGPDCVDIPRDQAYKYLNPQNHKNPNTKKLPTQYTSTKPENPNGIKSRAAEGLSGAPVQR